MYELLLQHLVCKCDVTGSSKKKYLWHGELLLDVALWTNECSAGSTVDV